MPSTIQHFAVNADDVDRARRFYESVFGWSFSAWGPPEFYQIDTGGRGDSSIAGALHKRRDVVPGKPIHGFECTIAVDNVDAIAETVKEAGGRVVMEKCVLR